MRVWGIVPAAGTGSRFGTETPKQYQLLAGEPVITRTLQKLLALDIEALVVAIHPADQRWQELPISLNSKVGTVTGGDERVDSVRAALNSLADEAHNDDWVLVHDVARPCVQIGDIRKLLSSLSDHPVGGILATPVSDTIKQVPVGSQEIAGTADRAVLWAAQTPQLFRYGVLSQALAEAGASNTDITGITDEASAVEQLGLTPLVIEGSRDNIKITRPEDLLMARAIIEFQEGR